LRHLLLNGTGMILCAGILVVTVSLKFFQGGWVTVAITGTLVVLAFLIRRHYRRFQFAATMLNLLVEHPFTAGGDAGGSEDHPDGRTVALFVNRYDGMGLHTLARVHSLLGKNLRRVIFVSVIQVDSDQLRSEEHLENLRAAREEDMARYEAMARQSGFVS